MNKIYSLVSKSALVSAMVVAAPHAAVANEMALTLKDNGITISGEFVGFEENAYIIATSAGEVYVPSKYVTCEGADCVVQVAANVNAE